MICCKKITTVLVLVHILMNFLYGQSIVSAYVAEKLSLRLDWKGIYITSGIRSTNYVRKIELAYCVRSRWNVGISALWGWRFGKNFGEDIGFDINSKAESGNAVFSIVPSGKYPTWQDKYTFNEWLVSLGNQYTALNYKYKGWGIFAEYQIDKNGIFEAFGDRPVHLWAYVGCSDMSGLVAGDLLYIKEKYSGGVFGSSGSVDTYVYEYEKIKYQNISADIMLRLRMQAKEKDIVLPSVSLYYVYAPDQAKNGMKNFGWLWDIRIILWKKK